MKDPQIQKRYFILSSFSRLGITINTNVYRFADKIIRDKWSPPLGDLNEVDSQIALMYEEFINGQR